MKKSLITLSIVTALVGGIYVALHLTGNIAAISTVPKSKSIKVDSELGEMYVVDLEERFSQKYSTERMGALSTGTFEMRERVYLLRELVIDTSVDHFQLMELGSFLMKVIHNNREYNSVKREAARVLIKVASLMAPGARQTILNAIGPKLLLMAQVADSELTAKLLED